MGAENPPFKDRIPGVIYQDEFEAFITKEWKMYHGEKGYITRKFYRQSFMNERGLVMYKGRIVYVGPENRALLRTRQVDSINWVIEDNKQVRLTLPEDEKISLEAENERHFKEGIQTSALQRNIDPVRERMLREAEEPQFSSTVDEDRSMSDVYEQNRKREQPEVDERLYEGLDLES